MTDWRDKFVYVKTDADEYHALPGWYFSDESYDTHGPFSTRDEAMSAIAAYAEHLNT